MTILTKYKDFTKIENIASCYLGLSLRALTTGDDLWALKCDKY